MSLSIVIRRALRPVYRITKKKKPKPISRDRRSIQLAQRRLKVFMVAFLRERAKEAADSIRRRNGDALKKALTDSQAHEAATSPRNDLPEPTNAQAKAGNYRKGHLNVGGLEISIENPAGSRRRPEWPTMQAHYGYIRGTVGNDGDHVDVFVRPETPEDYNGPVFVIDQQRADGSFDEHKVMLGWNSEVEARHAYLLDYAMGWTGLKNIKELTFAEFKEWIRGGDHSKPITKALTDEQKKRVQEILDELDLSGFVVLASDSDYLALLEAIARDGVSAATEQLGIDDSGITQQANERATEWARQRAAEMVGMRVADDGSLVENPNADWRIDDSTRDMVRGLVTQAESEGWSNGRLADALEESQAFSEARADMIARTETAYADVAGNMSTYREADVQGKSWLVSADACDICQANGAAGVIGIDDVFPSGDDAPPAHPGCECDVLPETMD